VKRSTLWILVVYAALALALGGCRKGEKASSGTVTQTIEPAKPQPAADTDTTALTQTVDVENGRSEVEGRTASGQDITATASDTATSGTTATMGTAPPPTTTTR
jgi:hypothetical protein